VEEVKNRERKSGLKKERLPGVWTKKRGGRDKRRLKRGKKRKRGGGERGRT